MNTLTQEIQSLKTGQPATFRNLTLLPLWRQEPSAGDPDYLLCEDAIAQGLARVTEMNGGGSVSQLLFENRAAKPVLLLDGEELAGAKQNRVLNLTILVPAQTTIVIPVSCVEAGRWHVQSDEFRPGGNVLFSHCRAARASQVTESMRATGSRRSDQQAVWEDIAHMAERMEAPSPTHRMSAAYERHAVSLDEYAAAFAAQPEQIGMVYAIAGGQSGADIFDHPATFARLFPKLLKSYALDALDAAGGGPGPDSAARDLLSRACAAPTCVDSAVGLGKDVRFVGGEVSGGALWAEGRYVHVCAFAVNGSKAPGKFETRLSRPSRRYQA
jgi:hypothetical protein